MLEHFFETYSLTQIIIFIILFALAVKEFINLIEEKNILKTKIKKKINLQNMKKKLRL